MNDYVIEVRRTTYITYQVKAESLASAEESALSDAETDYGCDAELEVWDSHLNE